MADRREKPPIPRWAAAIALLALLASAIVTAWWVLAGRFVGPE